jgi:hypothetical protein
MKRIKAGGVEQKEGVIEKGKGKEKAKGRAMNWLQVKEWMHKRMDGQKSG